MLKNTDLHIYLSKKVEPKELHKLLCLYGYTHESTTKRTNTSPGALNYSWKAPRISGYGLRLVYHEALYKDDLFHGNYSSFIIISGRQESTDVDLSMVDITAHLLTSRYGGVVHNPSRTDLISANVYLSEKV